MLFLTFAGTNNRGNCYFLFLQGFISMVFIIKVVRSVVKYLIKKELD